MKRITFCAMTLSFFGVAALAQPTQIAEIGRSDDRVYSVQISADDGRTYNCKPEIKNIGGVPVRACLRNGGAVGSVFDAGTSAGIGLAPTIAGGVVLLGVVANDSSSGTSTTTSTTGN